MDKPFEGRHFLLYAKGYYPKSDDVMRDMKILVGQLTAILPERLTESDVLSVLMEIALPLILQGNTNRRVEEILTGLAARTATGEKVGVKPIVEELLSFLQVSQIRRDNEVLIDMGITDPELSFKLEMGV